MGYTEKDEQERKKLISKMEIKGWDESQTWFRLVKLTVKKYLV
jgi:hypothetical protein